MVRKFLAVTFLVAIVGGILITGGCLRKLAFPPKFNNNLPDTIWVYTSTFQRGYRTFYLDLVVNDQDDSITHLRWTVIPGPSLKARFRDTVRFMDTVRLSQIDIIPEVTKRDTSWISFIVFDPGGLSANKTCRVEIDTVVFKWKLGNDTVLIIKGQTKSYLKTDIVHYSKLGYLKWTATVDPTNILICEIGKDSVKLKAEEVGTANVIFNLGDTVNHLNFSGTIFVRVKQQ